MFTETIMANFIAMFSAINLWQEFGTIWQNKLQTDLSKNNENKLHLNYSEMFQVHHVTIQHFCKARRLHGSFLPRQ